MPRPGSARPAPPKIKKQQEELEDQAARLELNNIHFLTSPLVLSLHVQTRKEKQHDRTFSRRTKTKISAAEGSYSFPLSWCPLPPACHNHAGS